MEDDGLNDCNDNDPWTFPGAVEDCDSRDNDCDNLVDEGPNDEENGACDFLVERVETPTVEPKACASITEPKSLWGLTGFAILGLFYRRRCR